MSSPDLKTLVVIGLSGAGLQTFNLLIDKLYPKCSSSHPKPKFRLIAIEKSKYAYWPPGSLRAAVIGGFEEKVVRSYEHIVPARIKSEETDLVKVVTGREVVELDFENRVVVLNQSLDEFGIEGTDRLRFDYLVIASGSSYPFPCRPLPGADSSQALKTSLRDLQQQINQSESLLIVGGGVVGIELAGEVSSKYKKTKAITLVSSSPALLPEYSKKLANSLEQQFVGRGVKILYGHRANLAGAGITKTAKLEKMTKIELTAAEGSEKTEVEADFVFLAIGNKPNTQFIPKNYLNPHTAQIRVNSSLQVLDKNSSEPLAGIYALGDVIDFEESKLYAALDGQAGTVAKNLVTEISDPAATKVVHKPLKDTIAIPLGPYGGGSQIFGFTFGLGPLPTSLLKGMTLFVGMFQSMYPDKDR